jgi:hypothetical protein
MAEIAFDALHWLNPPDDFAVEGAALTLRTRPRTDFWQRTHYGFRRDDGHFLFTRRAADFVAEASVTLKPEAEYDQAGLMVRCSASCWLKTACEYQPGKPSQLGAVVTNAGYSDWSYRPVTPFPATVRYRVERAGGDYIVSAQVDAGEMAVHRIARLIEDDGRGDVEVGIYACSPNGDGCPVTFGPLSVRPRP